MWLCGCYICASASRMFRRCCTFSLLCPCMCSQIWLSLLPKKVWVCHNVVGNVRGWPKLPIHILYILSMQPKQRRIDYKGCQRAWINNRCEGAVILQREDWQSFDCIIMHQSHIYLQAQVYEGEHRGVYAHRAQRKNTETAQASIHTGKI